MTTTRGGSAPSVSQDCASDARRYAALEQAARHLYDAECALHIARQSRIDAWIAAAADHLHLAVLELDVADRAKAVTELAQAADVHASVA